MSFQRSFGKAKITIQILPFFHFPYPGMDGAFSACTFLYNVIPGKRRETRDLSFESQMSIIMDDR
jgi:hypothetical protein